MTTQFTVYQSSDGSAPVLSGTAGALVTVLDAILVNGYGAKAAAGWSIAYTDTNKRVYQQGAGSSGCYYRVRDDGGGTGGAREALVFGAETMLDVNTAGSYRFPQASFLPTLTDNSLSWRKSNTADATARTWIAFADSRTIYMFVLTGDSANIYIPAMLGDTYSLVPEDTYTAALVLRQSESDNAANSHHLCWSLQTSANVLNSQNNQPGRYRQRNYTGTGAGTYFSTFTHAFQNTSSPSTNVEWVGALFYPNGADSALWLARPYMLDTTVSNTLSVFGWLRGIWAPCHAMSSFTDMDTLSGMAGSPLEGRTFTVIKGVNTPTNGCFIETSATVE